MQGWYIFGEYDWYIEVRVLRGQTHAPRRLSAKVASASLHNPNLILSQVIQPVYQAVNLPVGGLNLAFEDGLGLGRLGLLLVQVQHPLDQGNHLVVVGLVGGVVEVDGADEQSFCF